LLWRMQSSFLLTLNLIYDGKYTFFSLFGKRLKLLDNFRQYKEKLISNY
jgi:hypothetical protein